MAKIQFEPKDTRAASPVTPPLSPGVRRHLGQTLRSFYAASLSEPVSERMEALLARLDGRKS